MKILFALTLFSLVALIQAACQSTDSLSFCNNVNWEVDEQLFTNIKNHGTYAELMDKALERAYKLGKDYVAKVAEKHGFDVCDDCLEEFKNFLCAGAFPKCGIWPCLTEKLQAYLEEVLAKYGCEGVNDVTCIQKNYQNILKDLSKIPLDQFKDCYGTYMPSNAMCKGLIDICSCELISDAKKNSICQFFANNGNSWTQDGDCSDVNGWCAEVDEQVKRDEDDGAFPINSKLNLSVGEPAATTVLSIGVDEESSMNEPDSDDLGFLPPEEEDNASGASTVTILAFLYVAVAMLF